MIPEKRVQEMRERLEKATPGPWRTPIGPCAPDDCILAPDELELDDPIADLSHNENRRNDATFIAHAPNDIRDLLSEREELIATVAAQQHALAEVEGV